MSDISNAPSVDTIVSGYRKRAVLRVALVAAAALVLFTTVVIDVITGPADLSFWRVAHVIFDPSVATAKEEVIIWDLRLPIAMMAIVVGAMLGVSGAELQTILNNPLAEPFTLGLSMAASFGAAVAIVLGWSVVPGVGALFVTVNAFVFAMAASLLLFLATRLRGADPETMILMGIAMMFTFNALLAFLQYGASELQLAQLIFWQLGSLARATWPKVAVCAVILAIVLPYFLSRSWALTALRMGEDKAAALGVNVSALRLMVLAGVSLLSAVAVSFVGAIAFVGLVAPHIARMIVGEDQRGFLPLSALAGALILSGTSIASKAITPGIVYPIGMITSLIGIPFFVGLILNQRKRHWQ
ncbi:FecCD family ABC transporter permease [Phaeobacter gallaeciensis]|uniref:ABC-type Fe3+-siderophore transport system, permease component n=1 Tax=Phaeobacter gallaeciensis TaxID=60890 RepID=A0AAD0EER7_9RHOB|nr:iron ABC transporter permease [Phaeobacter gallaeciensis]AHD11555.1 ABC-type Fe3+-siderophore transport system, permease component [Phaeobacter gallaeciensis DSM 26640]ATE94819.1 ABC-type Fe3+-siderophore transport system, permease component [Phaeobacter gallaeciensis]ATE99091.1 ABC-type Fe3+-siderophore transport system, permease component [Phaeobacter gallaeciensis]ATF03483.1 ABC-type Fe3+-siderophore transport system, permease component [Phaeobacter gallaeciensis]ATF07863.1 ABC-type Fe3+